MGVDRTDYLMWGAKIDPDAVRDNYEDFEAEIDGAPGRRFDLIYDGMSGKYAIAGTIVAKSDPYEGLEFQEVDPTGELIARPDFFFAVQEAFPGAGTFKLYLFTHWH